MALQKPEQSEELKPYQGELNKFYFSVSKDEQARLEAMKVILNLARYRGRSRSLDFSPNRRIVISAEQELRRMRAQKKKYGHFIS